MSLANGVVFVLGDVLSRVLVVVIIGLADFGRMFGRRAGQVLVLFLAVVGLLSLSG